MKISQMTTDQAADVLIKIAEPCANIMHDKNTIDMLDGLAKGKDVSTIDYLANNIPTVITVLLKDHRQDVYSVVAALAGKTAQEVAEQKISVTIADVKACWDGELVDFFVQSK